MFARSAGILSPASTYEAIASYWVYWCVGYIRCVFQSKFSFYDLELVTIQIQFHPISFFRFAQGFENFEVNGFEQRKLSIFWHFGVSIDTNSSTLQTLLDSVSHALSSQFSSITPMKSFRGISTDIFLKWSKICIPRKEWTGHTSPLMIIGLVSS